MENEGSGQFITFFTLPGVLLLSVGMQAVKTLCGFVPFAGCLGALRSGCLADGGL